MGEWQKVFVNKLIEKVGLTHTNAMEVMGIVCDVRQVAYMDGYERGWAAAVNKGKPTAQPTTAPCCSGEAPTLEYIKDINYHTTGVSHVNYV